MSAIADLVAFLISAKFPPESVSVVVDLANRHGIEQVEIHRNSAEIRGNSAESSDDRRRRKDRERKRKLAENSAETKKPPLILTSFPEEILSIKGKKEESKRVRAREKKRLGPLPENWQPPDIAYPLAAECGTTVPTVDAIFRDYLKSSGKLYADHDAAFCNFVRNQNKFNGNQGKSANGRRTVHDAAKDLTRTLERIAEFDEPAPGGLCIEAGGTPFRLLPPR